MTQLAFGAAPLGMNCFASHSQSDEIAAAAIHRAHEAGIAFFDTAPKYGDGLSETRLGQVLSTLPRQSFTLQTKVLSLYKSTRPHFTRDGLLTGLHDSLERLQLDYADQLLLHDPYDYRAEVADLYPVLQDLKVQGLVQRIGFGQYHHWQTLAKLVKTYQPDCILVAADYNLLSQAALPLLDYCCKNKIQVQLGTIYAGGILADPLTGFYEYDGTPEPIAARVQTLQELCTRYQVPLGAVALQFCLAHPAVTQVIVGMSNSNEVAQNQAWSAMQIPNELWHELQSTLSANVPLPSRSVSSKPCT